MDPYVLKVSYAVEDQGLIYMVMEFVDLITIKTYTYCKRKKHML